jgi:hypothetical protein
MRVRISSFVVVLGAALFLAAMPLPATGQGGNPPAPTAPLTGRVQVPAAGEAAMLDGIITVRSTVSADPDGGPPILSYSCEASGRAAGESSGATFAVSGVDSGGTSIGQSLPADVGVACSLSLVSGSLRQQFQLTLQAGLDETGTITSLVIRTIAAL